MKTLYGFFLSVAILAAAASGIAQAVPPSKSQAPLAPQPATGAKPVFSLELSAVETTVKAGAPVRVRLITRNISDHRITLYYQYLGTYALNLDVHIKDGKDANPPETKIKRKIKSQTDPSATNVEPLSMNSAWVPLEPGKTREDVIDASILYNLNEPGNYTVEVDRGDDESKRWVKSNKVVVTVIP